jgi:two-component system OmpR family sensor kinase
VVPEESRAQTLALVADEVARMSRLVDELLLLAQSEQPDFLDPRPVDLADSRAVGLRRAESFQGPSWR